MKLFQFALIHTKPDRTDRDGNLIEGETTVLTDGIETLVAESQEDALILAARRIPDEYAKKLREVEIALRPF